MVDANGEKNLLRGVSVTLTAVLAIVALWVTYTQTTRFTLRDGLRHETRMTAIEVKGVKMDDKYDDIIERLVRIEALLQYNGVGPYDGLRGGP